MLQLSLSIVFAVPGVDSLARNVTVSKV